MRVLAGSRQPLPRRHGLGTAAGNVNEQCTHKEQWVNVNAVSLWVHTSSPVVQMSGVV